jgi:hypothetical protein
MICSRGPAVIEKKQNAWTDGHGYNLMPCTPSSDAIKIQQSKFKSMKERIHNGQKKRYKRTKTIYKTLHIKLKIE